MLLTSRKLWGSLLSRGTVHLFCRMVTASCMVLPERLGSSHKAVAYGLEGAVVGNIASEGVSRKSIMAEFSMKTQHWSLGLETFGDTSHMNGNGMTYSLTGSYVL